VAVDGGTSTEDDRSDWRSVMVDVSDMSLADLAAVEAAADPALAAALRRVIGQAAGDGDAIAGFNSAI